MLKRIAHISLIMLLLLGTSGITMYKHYCGGSLISKSIEIPPKNCCGEHCKGCHNESKTFKVTDNFEANNHIQNFKADVKQILDNFSFALVLIHSTFEFHSTNNLFYQVKICDLSHITAENPSALLQIFRL